MKKTAYIFSKLFFYGFTLTFIFVFVFSLLSLCKYHLGWEIPFLEFQNHKDATYTFVKLPIIDLGFGFPSGNFFAIAAMSIWLLFYVFYFYALKEFFKVFNSEKLFSATSLKKLQLFFKLNLIPVILALIFIFYSLFTRKKFHFDEEHFVFIVHAFVAFLIYLYLDLVKKGKQLQEENDLTI